MGDLVVDHTLRTLVRPVGFRSVPRRDEEAALMMARFWTGSALVDVLLVNDEDEVEAYRAQPDPQQPEDPYLFWRDVGSVCEMAVAVRRELVPPRAGSVPLILRHLRERDVPVPRPVGGGVCMSASPWPRVTGRLDDGLRAASAQLDRLSQRMMRPSASSSDSSHVRKVEVVS